MSQKLRIVAMVLCSACAAACATGKAPVIEETATSKPAPKESSDSTSDEAPPEDGKEIDLGLEGGSAGNIEIDSGTADDADPKPVVLDDGAPAEDGTEPPTDGEGETEETPAEASEAEVAEEGEKSDAEKKDAKKKDGKKKKGDADGAAEESGVEIDAADDSDGSGDLEL